VSKVKKTRQVMITSTQVPEVSSSPTENLVALQGGIIFIGRTMTVMDRLLDWITEQRSIYAQYWVNYKPLIWMVGTQSYMAVLVDAKSTSFGNEAEAVIIIVQKESVNAFGKFPAMKFNLVNDQAHQQQVMFMNNMEYLTAITYAGLISKTLGDGNEDINNLRTIAVPNLGFTVQYRTSAGDFSESVESVGLKELQIQLMELSQLRTVNIKLYRQEVYAMLDATFALLSLNLINKRSRYDENVESEDIAHMAKSLFVSTSNIF